MAGKKSTSETELDAEAPMTAADLAALDAPMMFEATGEPAPTPAPSILLEPDLGVPDPNASMLADDGAGSVALPVETMNTARNREDVTMHHDTRKAIMSQEFFTVHAPMDVDGSDIWECAINGTKFQVRRGVTTQVPESVYQMMIGCLGIPPQREQDYKLRANHVPVGNLRAF